MDPYLEARWPGVHVALVAFIAEALQPLLPRDLRARAEERVLLEDPEKEAEGGAYRSDVAVVEVPVRAGTPGRAPSANVATLEPILVPVPEPVDFDRFVKIIDVSNGNRVVTAIEVLSPWNKRRGRLNDTYRKKLSDYALGRVNVVEIDLLRSSRRDLEVGQDDLPPDRRTPYLVCVRRADWPGRWEVFPVPLRDRLPRIPIPLRRSDPDVGMELQPLIERVYAAGGHDDIDYSKPPTPPLDAGDAEWAAGLTRPSPR
jgi:hypothetical protein